MNSDLKKKIYIFGSHLILHSEWIKSAKPGRKGDEWTFPLVMACGTSWVRARARSGWAGCHGQPQAPVFPPSSCLCFSHSQKCSFFTVLLRSFPRVWARLWAGVSSGLAAVPARGYLLHLGWLEPPTPCIPGSKGGTLVTHLISGAWLLLSYLWSWVSCSPFPPACPLPSFWV